MVWSHVGSSLRNVGRSPYPHAWGMVDHPHQPFGIDYI